jgi:hypothetical protein
MRNESADVKYPTKQFLGGKFPPFLERIVQRIQNYFSVYNPPEYFENSRPPVTLHGDPDGLATDPNVILSCAQYGDNPVTCIPPIVNEDCEQSTAASEVSLNGAQPPVADDSSYNVVVTHTVVHDNMINVYSPSADPVGGQFVSNVLVVLEPSSSKAKTPIEGAQNKVYAYVQPPKTSDKSKNNNNVDTKLNEKAEYKNPAYTIFIRGDNLEDYTVMENVANASSSSVISVYAQNSTGSKFVKNKKCDPRLGGDCESSQTPVPDAENAILNSKSVPEERTPPLDVPNINLVLFPPTTEPFIYPPKNKTCTKNKYDTADTNANVEYYILKPDDGSLSKPKKSNGTATNFYFLSKTKLDNISPTYLPPDETDDAPSEDHAATSSYVMPVRVNYTSTRKPPFLLNLFRKRHEEPR